MNDQELTRWDLPYRYASRLFVPTSSLHIVAPTALFLALGLLDVLVLVPHSGGQVTSSNAIGLPISLLVEPAFAALYFWMPHAVTKLMQQLPASAVQGPRAEQELEMLRRLLAHPALPVAALLLAIAAAIVSSRPLPGGVPEFGQTATGGRAIFTYIVSGAVYYFLAMSLFRELVVTRFLVRLSSASEGVDFSVDPHHPDGAGGWAALGEYLAGLLLAVAAGIVAVSITLYTNTLEEAWQQLALSGALLIIFVVAIALPMWLVYAMMRPHRHAAVSEIRTRRRSDYESMRKAVADGEDVAPWLNSLRSLDEAERHVRSRHPVLPFRRPALLTVSTVSSLSIILGTTSTAVALIRTLTGS